MFLSMLSLVLLVNISPVVHWVQGQRALTENKAFVAIPIRLTIPSINVSANIQQVGITSKGEMDVPKNLVDVGWYNLGPRPGDIGSAVIDGHLNGKYGQSGVFENLRTVKKGDKLFIEQENGTSTTFVVRENRFFDPGYAEEVFRNNDTPQLNLITCDGVWDNVNKRYSKRLVIFSDVLQE